MWPFKNRKTPQEQFVQELTQAIGDTWRNISHVTRLFPDNSAAFRFVFSSYILALIFHEIERGPGARADLSLLSSAFPKSNEPKKISDVLIDPHDLWDFPEHIRIISGMKEFPDECSDLELPINILLLGVYFIRLERMRGYMEKGNQGSKSTQSNEENMFVAAGVLLSGYIFIDAFSLGKYSRDSAAMALDRAAVLRGYSELLYDRVMPISKKYA
jgi:hypothetical protein